MCVASGFGLLPNNVFGGVAKIWPESIAQVKAVDNASFSIESIFDDGEVLVIVAFKISEDGVGNEISKLDQS